VLRSYNDNGNQVLLEAGAFADAEFAADRVHGFGGCGDYDAVYRANGRALIVSDAATTLQSCGSEVDAFQGTYLSLLGQSRAFSERQETLTISAPGLFGARPVRRQVCSAPGA
jgi:heat shock protein HslJ